MKIKPLGTRWIAKSGGSKRSRPKDTIASHPGSVSMGSGSKRKIKVKPLGTRYIAKSGASKKTRPKD